MGYTPNMGVFRARRRKKIDVIPLVKKVCNWVEVL